MIAILFSLIIWGLIFWVLRWGLSAVDVGDPFQKIANIVLVIAAVIVVIGLLMGSIAPFGFLPFR